MSNTSPSRPRSTSIAWLAEEMKVYWRLLETAVRLEGPWDANLEPQQKAAANDAIQMGRSIAGQQRPINTLAELRQLLLDVIGTTLAQLGTLATQSSLSASTREFTQKVVEDLATLKALLAGSVDIRTCSCTTDVRARRQLVLMLGEKDAAQFIDAAADLTKLACTQAVRRLTLPDVLPCAPPQWRNRHGSG